MLNELQRKQYEKQLEILLQRKAKADALPEEEKKKWEKEYQKLLNEIAHIKKLLGDEFDLETALDKLIKTLRELSIRINYSEIYPKTEEFFEAYPDIAAKIQKAWDKVEYGLKHKFKDEFETGLKEVCESFELVAKKIREEKEFGFNFYVYDEGEKVGVITQKQREKEKVVANVEQQLSFDYQEKGGKLPWDVLN